MTKKFMFELLDGLPLEKDGEIIHQKQVEFKELTAQEIFVAQDKSEEVRSTPDGYELVASPSKLSRELVRLSVRKVGDIDGISMALMGKLSARDLSLLFIKHEEFTGLNNAILNKRLEEAKKVGKP